MANVSNKAINTGSVANKQLSSQSLRWQDADFSWNNARGTWNNPYAITNKGVNTASVSNKALNG